VGEPLNQPPTRVGLVGCGTISVKYLDTIAKLEALRLTAVADVLPDRAAAVAGQHQVAALPVAELLTAPDVDLVLNLTIPRAHAEVALAAVAAGKSVYGEKPLAVTTAEAATVLAAAESAGVLLGCAPDTVLGTGTQTARRVIDDGLIGTPIAATATMVTPGHERWHPDPDFYYQPGGGPLFDMGPYYISALVTLLGPVRSVIGAASHLRTTRTIGTGPRAGQGVPVEVDSHVTGVLVHESGVLSTLLMSFDIVQSAASRIEVHGDRGSLIVPDPNHFDGAVRLHPLKAAGWETLPPSAGYLDGQRGYGLADLVHTASGAEPRTSGRFAYHVLDVMESLLQSAATGCSVTVDSTCARPAPVALSTAPGGLSS